MIELSDFSLRAGHKQLLLGVNALFDRATLTALVGRNGTGKSTLLRTLAGLHRGYNGSLMIAGNSAIAGTPAAARMIAFVSTARMPLPALSCREVVSLGRAPFTNWYGSLSETDNVAVERAMNLTDISDLADRRAETLSDGEWQRMMIARAIAQDTPAIILDEPTSFLDIPNRQAVCRLLETLAHGEGKCVIFSTHEVGMACSYADNVALIDNSLLNMLPTAGGRALQVVKQTFGLVDTF